MLPPSRINGQKLVRSLYRRPADPSEHLGTARYPCERLGGDETSPVRIERSFSIVGLTRDLLDQFAIRLETSASVPEQCLRSA